MNKKSFTLPAMLLVGMLLSCTQKQQTTDPTAAATETSDTIMRQFTKDYLYWTREPKQYTISDSLITIETEPNNTMGSGTMCILIIQ